MHIKEGAFIERKAPNWILEVNNYSCISSVFSVKVASGHCTNDSFNLKQWAVLAESGNFKERNTGAWEHKNFCLSTDILNHPGGKTRVTFCICNLINNFISYGIQNRILKAEFSFLMKEVKKIQKILFWMY